MSIDQIRAGLARARESGGVVDAAEFAQIAVDAKDGGVIDREERTELLAQFDGFDRNLKAQVIDQLSATGPADFADAKRAAFQEALDQREVSIVSHVPGLESQAGFVNGIVDLQGTATANGTLTLKLGQTSHEFEVSQGETAPQVLARLCELLLKDADGHIVGVNPSDVADGASLIVFNPEDLKLRPGETPLRVMVTGYGPFGRITDNPSDAMAKRLEELGIPGGGGLVETRTLEVTLAAVDAFVAEMQQSAPDVVLSMGVSSRSQVEELPNNIVAGGTDGRGDRIQPGVIRDGGPDELSTDLPLGIINDALDTAFEDQRMVGSSAFDVNYRPDRSAYLCNYLGYKLAEAFGSSTKTAAGFVHITSTTKAEQMHVLLQAVVAHQLVLRRLNAPVP